MTERKEQDVAADAAAYLGDDPHLGPLVAAHGPLALDPNPDLFERLVIAVLRQQVSTAAAEAIETRLFEAVEVTPDGVLAADEATLTDAGLSAQKAGYLESIAEAFLEEGYSRAQLAPRSNDEIRDILTGIRGVGPWTADMQLMFSFGRPDVFPVGDLGIRKGMEIVFDEELTRAEMVDRARQWEPYRSYASLYLWRAVD